MCNLLKLIVLESDFNISIVLTKRQEHLSFLRNLSLTGAEI